MTEMKKFSVAFFAGLLLYSRVALADLFLFDSPGFNVGGPEPFTCTFLGAANYASGATITGSFDIGAVDATKEIFITSATRGASARTLTAASSTVDSIAVTKFTTEFTSGQQAVSGAFVATPSNSGTVTVTMTYSGNPGSGSISVYKCIGRPGIGTNETDSSTSGTTATSATLSATTIPANGLWLSANAHANTDVTTQPTDTTLDHDFSDGSRRSAHASRAIQAASSTPTDVWSWTNSIAQASASWAFQ